MKIQWRTTIILFFGLTMFTSLIYQIVWIRNLSFVLGTTVHAFSAVVTAFMAGLALGAYWLARMPKKKQTITLFGKISLALGISGLILPLLFNLMKYPYFWFYNAFGSTTIIFFMFVIALITLIIPTTLIGATFPLITNIYTRKIGADVSNIYAIDTIFAGIGALCTGLIFLPYLGLIQTTILAAIINLGIGFFLKKEATL